MNELFFKPILGSGRGRRLVKNMLYSTASRVALGGLFPGRLEDGYLRIERHEMPLPGLGKGFDGARLAHISDVHASPLVLKRYLRQCIARINRMEVDFVAVTGDFVTGRRFYARRIARILGELNPRVAVLACLGNHDYGIFHPKGSGGIEGLSDYIAHRLCRADIFVMLNETRIFRRNGSAIQFVGLEDYWSSRYDPRLAFEYAHRHLPTVALVHNPDAATEVAAHGADWVLAGHTHGTGVATPLGNMLLPTSGNFVGGHYPLANNRNLYVNRGMSYGRRVMPNGRPEITVFTLRDAPARKHP